MYSVDELEDKLIDLAFAEDIAAQKASGMDDSVLKPIDFRVLREKLEKYLSIRRRG